MVSSFRICRDGRGIHRVRRGTACAPLRVGFTADFVEEGEVFFGERGRGQQIRPVAQSLFERRAAAPLANIFVVSAYQHVRDFPAAIDWRPREVWAIEDAGLAKVPPSRAAG